MCEGGGSDDSGTEGPDESNAYGTDEGIDNASMGGLGDTGGQDADSVSAADAAGMTATMGAGVPGVDATIGNVDMSTPSSDLGFSDADIGALGIDEASPGVGMDTTAISPEFAAPDDPTNPGISAPTEQQDALNASMSPGMGVMANAPTPDSLADPSLAPTLGLMAPTQTPDPTAPGYDPNKSFFENLRVQRAIMDPFNNPNPVTIGLRALGMVNPAFSGLAMLGMGLNALGATPGTDVDAYGAAIGDVGMGDDAGGAANDETGLGIGVGDGVYDPFGGGLGSGGGGGGGGGSGGGSGSQPDAWQRPGRIEMPDILRQYISPGMTDLQIRSAIATGALYNSNPVYRAQPVKDYYNNLVARALIDEAGNFNDINALLPVEGQYARQSRGVRGYGTDVSAFLAGLGVNPAAIAATAGTTPSSILGAAGGSFGPGLPDYQPVYDPNKYSGFFAAQNQPVYDPNWLIYSR